MCNIWLCHYAKLLWSDLKVKALKILKILKIGPLKITLNIKSKIIIVKDFIKNTRKILKLNQIIENKVFWKTIKPFLSDKSIQSSTVTFVNKENNQTISDDFFLFYFLFYFFLWLLILLGIKEYKSSATDNTNSESKHGADLDIEKYKDHLSIKMINEHISLNHGSVLNM